ncbi:choice-of-anchor D domain-containing protein [bacterium]|nr:choice-of-anchor D domain-containing protein [bacterium]
MQRLPIYPAVLVLCTLILCIIILPGTAHAQNTGPLLRFTPPVAAFDTVSCGRSASLQVTVENIGTEAATISQAAAVTAPFSGAIPAPLILQPGNSRQFTLQYAPDRAPHRDSLLLNLVADSPVPTGMTFLFDASTAMAESFDGASRIAAAHDAAAQFLDVVMAEGAPAHEGAVYTYSGTSDYRLLRASTPDRTSVKSVLPTQATGTEACVWDAMLRTIGFMQTEARRSLLIVFLAGEDAGVGSCGPRSSAGVINAAQSAGIAVHIVAFTTADAAALQSIADQTSGSYNAVSNAADLQQALDAVAMQLNHDVPQQYVLRGEAVSPVLRITPPRLIFDATRARTQRSKQVVLHNDGTAPMDILSLTGLPPSMTFDVVGKHIDAGDSLHCDVQFTPEIAGLFEGEMMLQYNGCGSEAVSFVAHGTGYDTLPIIIGPVFSLVDTVRTMPPTYCSDSASVFVRVNNPGNTAVAYTMQRSGSTAFLPASGEAEIPSSGSRMLEFQLDPDGSTGNFLATYSFDAVSRLRTRTVVIADLGADVNASFEGTLQYGDAARLAFHDVMMRMSNKNPVIDELGWLVMFNDGSTAGKAPTRSRSELETIAIPRQHTDSSCVLSAVRNAVQMLGAQGTDRDLRIILLTSRGDADTSTCAGDTPAAVQSLLHSAGVVCNVLLMNDSRPGDELQSLALNSGGRYRSVGSLASLRQEIHALQQAESRMRTYTLTLSGSSVSSLLTVTENLPRFPDTRVREESCQDLVLRNTGEGTLVISGAELFHDDYRLDATLPMSIEPGEERTVQVCFAPRLPGSIVSGLRLTTNACGDEQKTVFLDGRAWDSLSVSVAGNYVTRPGGLVRIPVTFTSELEQAYGMRELHFRIAYNPTLLFPDEANPAEDAEGNDILHAGSGSIEQGYDPAAKLATTSYHFRRSAQDAPISTEGNGRTIAWLRLRAYLGNDTECSVMIDSVSSNMEGLTLGSFGTASVRIDSMTWLEERLIDASARTGITLGKPYPNPARDRVTVPYSLLRDTEVTVSVFDSFGRLVRQDALGWRRAGAHGVDIPCAGLPSGLYLYRISSGTGSESATMLISR